MALLSLSAGSGCLQEGWVSREDQSVGGDRKHPAKLLADERDD